MTTKQQERLLKRVAASQNKFWTDLLALELAMQQPLDAEQCFADKTLETLEKQGTGGQ